MAETDFNSGETPGSSGAPSTPQPRKTRRLMLKIIAIVVALLILLVLAAPTLLSTGPAVSIILAQVNKQLNGKVQIASLSLGWFTGIKVDGVQVTDASGTQIAEIDHATVPYPLIKALTGKLAFGDVVLDGVSFDAKKDANGQLNFAQLTKPSPGTSSTASTPAPATESKPSKLPDISVNLKLTNCHGTFSQAGKPTVYLTKLDGQINIPNINQPITDQLNAAVKLGDQPEGTIALSGTAAAINANQIALNSAEIHQKLELQNIDLQIAKPFIPDSVGVSTLDGALSLHVAIDLTAGKNAAIDAAITATKPIAFGGKVLQGDTFTTKTFQTDVPKLTAVFSDGLDKWQSGRITVGAAGGSLPILFKLDQGQVTLVADLMPQAILNVIARQKPGSTGQLVVTSNFDLAGIIPQLRHSIPEAEGVIIKSAGLTEKLMLTLSPDKSNFSNSADSTPITGEQTINGQTKPLSIPEMHLSIAAADLGGGGALPNLHGVLLKLQTSFANGEFQGESLSDLHGNLNANLQSLQSQIGQFVDLGKVNFQGDVSVDLTGHGNLTDAPYQGGVTATVGLKDFKYSNAAGRQVNQSSMQVIATADLQGATDNASVTLKLGDGSAPIVASVTGAVLSPSAKSVLDQVQTAHWQVDVPDLKPVMDLANAFSPPRADKSAPPLNITSGAISLNGDLSHDNSTVKINVSNVSAKNVSFTKGTVHYTAKPVDVKLLVAIQTGDGKTVMDQIRQVQITQLTGNLGIATLSMPTPISISQLSTTPVATGTIQLVGNLTDLTQLLSAVQGQKPDAYPYRGDYTLSENISTQQNTIKLNGGIQIAKFQSYNSDAVTFSEDLVNIGNDLSVTTIGTDESVAITSFTAAMQSSGAANISLKNGSINHLQTTRDMQLQLNVNYDLAKLWPIIQPLMGDQYKTLKIAGQYQKQFNVAGSYPANAPTTVAIKTLHADGDVAVASFDYDGLNLQNFILPFTLNNGQLVTIYANKPAGQNTAAPAVANGGTLDLSNLTIDLTQDPPRLTTPPKKALIKQVTINPIFAGTFLKNVINNPLFAGAKGATGLIDLNIDDCTNLPLGDLVMQQTPANSGKADLNLSITKLNIGLALDALQSVLKQQSFEADVKNGTIAIAKGVATEHINFSTGKYVLSFDGSVRLKDQAYIPMVLGFPAAAIAKVTKLPYADFYPDQLKVPMEGTVSNTKYRFDKVLPQAAADAAAKAIAGGLLGGNKNGNGGNSNNNDPLGGLLNDLGKKKKQK